MSHRFNTRRDLARGRLTALQTHYVLGEDAFPECRHCGRLVGWKHLRTHLLDEHAANPKEPFLGVAM